MQILISLTTFHPAYILTRLGGKDRERIKNGSKIKCRFQRLTLKTDNF